MNKNNIKNKNKNKNQTNKKTKNKTLFSQTAFLGGDISGLQAEMHNAWSWFQNDFKGILQSLVDAQKAASFIFACTGRRVAGKCGRACVAGEEKSGARHLRSGEQSFPH